MLTSIVRKPVEGDEEEQPEEEEEEEEDENAEQQEGEQPERIFDPLIMPNHIQFLNADDDFLNQRIKFLPED